MIVVKNVNYGGTRGVVPTPEKWRVLQVTKNKIQAQGGLRYPEWFNKKDSFGTNYLEYEIEENE